MKHQKRTRHCEEGAARRGNPLRLCIALLVLILLTECAYCIAVFTDWVPALTELRNQFIETALGTMEHKWLATVLFPGDVVREVWEGLEGSRLAQTGQNSGDWEWTSAEAESLWERFPELQEDPALDPGADWDGFYVNHTGPDDPETGFVTLQGDRVLA